MVELHYYKNIEEEDSDYLTWQFLMEDLYHRGGLVATIEKGWTKKETPKFTSSQAEEAARWFYISNEEDKHFIEMEKLYCELTLNKELKEIELAQENNKKILKILAKE